MYILSCLSNLESLLNGAILGVVLRNRLGWRRRKYCLVKGLHFLKSLTFSHLYSLI